MSWFGFQGWEPIIILLVILLIFGPTKLPQLAKGLGEALREFRKASAGAYDTETRERETKSMAEEAEKGKIDEEMLKKLAEKLGVESEGKSKEKLLEEVLEKAKEKGLIEK